MLTFYNRHGVQITSQWVAIEGSSHRLRDLQELRTSKGPVNRIVVRTLGGGISLMAMALLLGAVMPVAMTAALGLTGLIGVGLAFVLSHTHPREWALTATFRGREQLLLVTTDLIELGKLTRALRRAREFDRHAAMSF